ncbi:unnamed protein product [Leptidea sinapis]|uniref:Protein MIS12 homolog n=1 Tax=Leptidea sinapis TaxID=189913 RepID=A0A5E4PYW1_9NEOP|nr:unnamed protein product [Leptidea sinapis]
MIQTEPWTGGTDEEYETQHFGFGCQRFKIALRKMVEEKISGGVMEMVTALHSALNLNDTDKQTLTNSCNKLIHLYCERTRPSLDIIDNELEKLLKIPHNILLPEDEVQFDQVMDEEFEKLKEEVSNLQQIVQRGAMMESLLTAEEEELASVEKLYELSRKDMEVIDLLQKNLSNTDNLLKILQSNTQFITALVPSTNKNNDIP